MIRPCERRGVTLMEILVAMAVLGLLTTGALTLFLPTMGRFASADTTYETQRQILIGIRMLSADLRESQQSLILQKSLAAGSPAALAIPTPRDARLTFHRVENLGSVDYGKADWQGWVVYWCVADSDTPQAFKLLRTRFDGPVPAGSTYDPFGNLPRSAPVVAAGVTDFLVTPQQTAGGRGSVSIRLKSVRYLHDHPTSFEGDETIDMPY